MACNCASSKQIEELYKRYGDKRDIKNLSFKQKVKYYAQYTAVTILMIPTVPLLVLFILYKGLFDDDKKISFKKFFNLKQNVILNAEQ